MPKYMIQASYSPEGLKGLAKEGGSGRRAYVEELVQKLGGRLEAFYFAFGESDTVAIVEFPDAVTSAALSVAVNQSGVVQIKTTALLAPDEMDQALKNAVGYRPPGS